VRHDIDGDGKIIDLHPFTTREERQTLSDTELDALIALRKAQVRVLRLARPDGSRWWEVAEERFQQAMRWLGLLWYNDVFQAWLQVEVAKLAKVPDPDGDGWTPYEIAAHLRGAAIDKLDDVAKWEKVPEFLAAFGLAEVGGGVGAMLEALDGPILDGLLGNPLETYILALLVAPDERVDLKLAGFAVDHAEALPLNKPLALVA